MRKIINQYIGGIHYEADVEIEVTDEAHGLEKVTKVYSRTPVKEDVKAQVADLEQDVEVQAQTIEAQSAFSNRLLQRIEALESKVNLN